MSRLFRPLIARFALIGMTLAGLSPAAVASTYSFRSTGVAPFAPKKTSATAAFNFPNPVCRSAQISELEVQEGLANVPVNVDYCELAAARLPKELIALLARIREIHARYAVALGRSPEELFGPGVRLSLAEHPLGPLESFTSANPSSVEIDLFGDFRAERFPDRIYAHEVTHWLLLEGRLGDAGLTIEGDYLFHESFPDLLSSYATDASVIGFSDPTVRAALRFERDGTPVQSMNRPFREFYLGRFQTEPVKICATIPTASMTENEREMCKFFRSDASLRQERSTLYSGSRETAPTPAELAAPFRPERCLIHYRNGTAGLNACYMNALGPVLVSFVRSIGSLLGEKPMATLMAAIDRVGQTPDHYACTFVDRRAIARSAGETVTVDFLSFMRVFKSIRDGLPTDARATFDSAWAAHGLDTWATLDRFDRDTVVAAFAYQALVRENRRFAAKYDCLSPIPSRRGPHCAAKCEYAPSEALATTPAVSVPPFSP